jgi:site-specific DNA-methyltransferase (adenine-specific)
MKMLPDSSIDLGVTSPPFDNLRQYGGTNPFSWEIFQAVADQLHRVLKQGGIVAWDVQDEMKDGNVSSTSFRQVLYFQEIGFFRHETLIIVSNGGKLPCKNHYPNVFRYCFILAKGRPDYVNVLRDRPNRNVGQINRPHVRRFNGRIEVNKKTSITGPYGERNNVWPTNVGWNKTTTDQDAFQHPALMPEKQAEDLIISYSRPGEVVLDPFSGAGTTVKMALLNDRRYVGFEIHKEYHDLAIKRLQDAQRKHQQRLDAFFLNGEILPRPQSERNILHHHLRKGGQHK